MTGLIVFTDGTGFSPSIGSSNVGAIYYKEGRAAIYREWLKDKLTAPMAEYTAVLLFLRSYNNDEWNHQIPNTDLTIYSDSLLVVKQLNGEWRIDKPHLKEIIEKKIVPLLLQYKSYQIKHIPGKENPADPLTREDLYDRALRIAEKRYNAFMDMKHHVCNGITLKDQMKLDEHVITVKFCPMCGKELK